MEGKICSETLPSMRFHQRLRQGLGFGAFVLGGPFDLVSRVSKVGYWGL